MSHIIITCDNCKEQNIRVFYNIEITRRAVVGGKYVVRDQKGTIKIKANFCELCFKDILKWGS